jgi:hypothetical protein
VGPMVVVFYTRDTPPKTNTAAPDGRPLRFTPRY